jgi:phospholipid-transporting ATPase
MQPSLGLKAATESKELNQNMQNFSFKDEELMGILRNDAKYKHDGEFPVNLIITSSDGKVKLELKKQKELINEYFFLLSSAHECLV